MYSLTTSVKVFEEMIGGESHQYIKMKEVAQNEVGDKYALVYFDDGKFKLRTFGRDRIRSPEEIGAEEVDINKLLDINDDSMAITALPEPFITCCFIDDDLLFIQLVFVPDQIHYHFLWNIKDR
jgi:hypothetical protein